MPRGLDSEQIRSIPELLRNGASLPEAKELARHSDVKMTMRYTHIGMQDQANALQHLPCQHIVSISTDSDCQKPSLAGATVESDNETTTGETDGCDVSCHPLAVGDKMEAAGIEPASRDSSVRASTCIAASFDFARPAPTGRVLPTASLSCCLAEAATGNRSRPARIVCFLPHHPGAGTGERVAFN